MRKITHMVSTLTILVVLACGEPTPTAELAPAPSSAVVPTATSVSTSVPVATPTNTPDPTATPTAIPNPTPTPVPPSAPFVLNGFTSVTPRDSENVVVYDLTKIRGDANLVDLYDRVYRQVFNSYSIELASAQFSAFTDVLGLDPVYLVQGSQFPNEILSVLDELGYNRKNYRNVALWEASGDPGTERFGDYVAFPRDDLVVFSNSVDSIRSFIRTSRGESDSLADDTADVASRLPTGIMSGVFAGCEQNLISQSCEAFGRSFLKRDSKTLEFTLVFKFGSAAEAQRETDRVRNVLDDPKIRRDLLADSASEVKVIQSGVFIEIRGQMDLQDFG